MSNPWYYESDAEQALICQSCGEVCVGDEGEQCPECGDINWINAGPQHRGWLPEEER